MAWALEDQHFQTLSRLQPLLLILWGATRGKHLKYCNLTVRFSMKMCLIGKAVMNIWQQSQALNPSMQSMTVLREVCRLSVSIEERGVPVLSKCAASR